MAKTAAKPGKSPRRATIGAKKQDATTRDISGQAIAAAFEISDRRVQQLANDGVIERTSHGRYKLAGFAAAIAKSQVDGEAKRLERQNPASAIDLDQERGRKLRLENDETEGLLIRTDAVMALVDWIFGAMETALAGVPAQFTGDVAERRRLEHVMDEVRRGIARDYDQARANTLASGDPLNATGTHVAG